MMFRLYSLTIICALVYENSAQEFLRMCTCNEVIPCKDGVISNIIPCTDRCQRFAGEVGADFNVLRDCILEYRPQIRQTIECVKDQLRDTCSAVPTDMQVQKRYPIGIELALVEELGSMFNSAGLQDELMQYIPIGRRFAHCLMDCVETQTNRCVTAAQCGLNLPPDNQIVQFIKTCAIQNGVLTTATLQSVCACAVRSGVAALENVCPRLIVQ